MAWWLGYICVLQGLTSKLCIKSDTHFIESMYAKDVMQKKSSLNTIELKIRVFFSVNYWPKIYHFVIKKKYVYILTIIILCIEFLLFIRGLLVRIGNKDKRYICLVYWPSKSKIIGKNDTMFSYVRCCITTKRYLSHYNNNNNRINQIHFLFI